MGMDMYLIAAHSKKELEDPHFWTYIAQNTNDKFSKPGELYYARKFWDLFYQVSFTQNYECGEYKVLTKENVEEMLQVACHNRDYFDGFTSVPQLCEILDRWNELVRHNLSVFFECDW